MKETVMCIFLGLCLCTGSVKVGSDETFHNDYFFDRDFVLLQANARYCLDSEPYYGEDTVYIIVSLVRAYERGNLYRFRIQKPDDCSEAYRAEDLNLYFYVMDSYIFRVTPISNLNGEYTGYYEDEELLKETFDTDIKLMNAGYIVWQESDYQGESGEGTVTWENITKSKDGNTVAYSMYQVKNDGEGDLGYYTTFIWEKGEGLTEYITGHGAEADILYLTEISEVR